MAQSIKRNAFYNVLLNIAAVIFPLITAPYVSRVLEPDGVGLFNFSFTYSGYFALVAMLGIPTYGVREVSKIRNDKEALSLLVSQLLSIAAVTTLFVSSIYILTIALIGQLSENFVIFLIAGFVIYLAPFRINWFYQGIEEFGIITKVTLIVRTLSVICLFVFVKEKNDLVIYVVLSVLGTVLADMWNYSSMICSGIKPKLTFKGLKPHVGPLMILFASSIAVSIYTVLDTIMLGFITDYDEVGYYSNALHISRVIMTVVTSLSLVVVPRVSYYMKNKDFENINVLINKSFSIVTFLSFPISLGLICLAPVFVPLFFGEHFMGAVIPLMILSLLIPIIGLNNLTGTQILIGFGLDKLLFYSVLAGTISNFILNCIMIPLYGSIGASVASVSAEILVLAATIIFVMKHTTVRVTNWNDILKAVFGSLLLLPLALILKNLLEGWFYVMVFTFSGSILYLTTEAVLNNSMFYLCKSTIISKIKK